MTVSERESHNDQKETPHADHIQKQHKMTEDRSSVEKWVATAQNQNGATTRSSKPGFRSRPVARAHSDSKKAKVHSKKHMKRQRERDVIGIQVVGHQQ